MRASMLILTALLVLGVPSSRAGEEAHDPFTELSRKYQDARERLSTLEENQRQAVNLVACLQLGRAPGDQVYIDAQTYLGRVEADLDKQKAEVAWLGEMLKAVPAVRELHARLEEAKYRADRSEGELTTARTDLANANLRSARLEARVDALQYFANGNFESKAISELGAKLAAAESREKSLNAQLNRARADLSGAKSVADATALRLQGFQDAAAFGKKLKAPFELVQTSLRALEDAINARDRAQADFDARTKSNAQAKADALQGARTALDQALKDLANAVHGLKTVLHDLNLLTSRTAPTDDAGTIRRAAYFAHEDEYSFENIDEAMPPVFVDGGSPSIETIDGVVFESDQVLTPPVPRVPPFTPLDPPDAPPPPKPERCVVGREIPLDDPAGSWRMILPGTLVRRLPRPGDVDDPTETAITTSMTTTGSTTTTTTTTTTTRISTATTPLERESIVAPRKATRSVVFDCPAYFPITRFKDRTKTYEDEGLRIVEGMVLRIDDEGCYEVEFQAQGIATPVVLRLQLMVDFEDQLTPVGSITLPPIRLDPRTQARSDDGRAGDDAAWLIVHRGRSSRLRRAFLDNPDAKGLPTLDVRRDGAAMFGSGLPPTTFLPR